MSVLINMKMPIDCVNCPAFKEVFDAECRITGKSVDGHWSCILQNDVYPRPDWCPLIEVPPHGDLIDRDALWEHVEDLACNIWVTASGVPVEALEKAPTVIEASEGST